MARLFGDRRGSSDDVVEGQQVGPQGPTSKSSNAGGDGTAWGNIPKPCLVSVISVAGTVIGAKPAIGALFTNAVATPFLILTWSWTSLLAGGDALLDEITERSHVLRTNAVSSQLKITQPVNGSARWVIKETGVVERPPTQVPLM